MEGGDVMMTIECPECGTIISMHTGDATERAARRSLERQLEEASAVIAQLQAELSRVRP